MYSSRPNLMLGFHGCDESAKNALISQPDVVKTSKETYDWLGHGFYVWENNYERALQWAEDKKARGQIEQPAVIGVVYQLNHCLDFTDSSSITTARTYYELMKLDFEKVKRELPQNKDLAHDIHKDKILRELDCAVIEYLHQKIDEAITNSIRQNGHSNLAHFDTARGIFTEGGPAFDGAGIQAKSHIQICIRNLNCIKGFFIPRKKTQPFLLNN